jgi:ectoine hydroxylase-related dioxygenase (phytanoyl-CoA dioxygenase family)
MVNCSSQVEAFRRDGVVCLRSALGDRELAIVRDAFDYRMQNARRSARSSAAADGSLNYSDLFKISTWAHPTFQSVFHETPLADYAAELTGSAKIWFFYEQVFVKEGGAVRRTPWHQDTPYLPTEGEQIVRFWITLDPVPQACSLEFVRGSHQGTLYNGSAFDPADDTLPLYPDADMPRLPDIEASRESFDIVSWAVEPGDIIAFHPRVLHGGAPAKPDLPRHTLSLMYFGEDATFVERPTNPMFIARRLTNGETTRTHEKRADKLYSKLSPGDPFRDPVFPMLRPGVRASRS